ncbi:MAG: carbohydrate binding family 9 domain-containing protein, partial [Tannerella sp.]|nr:carbohydrate binding family 9 domain-containing protein [Tannerella sp.]
GNITLDFVQVTPFERRTSSSPTRAKLLYDEKYIYVGVWCRDSHPDKTIRFIGNRDDNSVGDLISIAFDTYHDYRAAPEFNINVGGNKTDLIVTDKLEINRSWNAVWEGRTHFSAADSLWTAELRIPFSQLRYNRLSDDGLWGLHIRRVIRRNNEVQNWSMIPLKNNGHVFSFGSMQGMNDLPKSRGIEFLPYVMTKFRAEQAVEGHPYKQGDSWERNAGFDAKFGLSDYTLDMTVNPDFGQIELDPSVMNLTAYETFYDEKRPFFLEGKHILDFADGSNMMFYTRRIGAAPSFTPSGDYIESKGSVPIIGALKLTGTNRHGLTVGAIQSLTAGSSARVMSNNLERRDETEPRTNYTVMRLQKNWKGNTLLGGMITSVNRFFGYNEQNRDIEPVLKNYMPQNAYTAGLDFTQYFHNRLYYIDMKGMFSSLTGSREAITLLQNSAVHYYGRASASDYLGVNYDLTTLNGTGGYIKIGRKGNDKWTFSETFGWASPGFDLNDVGYLKQADILRNTTEIQFRRTDIWKFFRSNTITFSQTNEWDYSHTPIHNNASLTWKMMFLNRFELTASEQYGWNQLETRQLRGGPDLRYDPYYYTSLTFNTDKALPLLFSLSYINDYNSNRINLTNTIKPSVTLRLGNHVRLNTEFTYTDNRDATQYVSTINGETYSSLRPYWITGMMEQKTYVLTMNLQVNITPDVSFQFYGSPFTSSARYSDFKIALDPSAKQQSDRYFILDDEDLVYQDGKYKTTFGYESAYYGLTFSNPDFTFNEFRSNVVARWEYLPGSTLYFVWQHRMSDRSSSSMSNWGDNLDRIFSLPSANTFMLKVNYWFAL